MSRTRAKRDIDWEVGTSTSNPIGVSRAWVTSLGTNGTFSNPATSDNNRLGIILVSHEDSGGGAEISTVTVDGQTATEVIDSFAITAFSNEVALFYLTESQLSNITDGSAINITYTTGSTNSVSTFSVILNNVSQTSPVVASDEDNGTGTGALSLTAVAENLGYSVVCIADGTSGTTIAQSNSNYTEIFNGATGTEYVTGVYAYEGTQNETITVNWTSSTPLREVSLMVNFRSI